MYKQAPEAIGIYSDYKIIGRIEEKEMKRNSKRFLALFLSVAMTVTPAVLTQAETSSVKCFPSTIFAKNVNYSFSKIFKYIVK